MTAFAALSLGVASRGQSAEYRVFYLGGQSNMDGYGRVSELPESDRAAVNDGVMIFHGNTARDGEAVDGRGVWAKLRPGHGVGFNRTAQPTGIRIGLESNGPLGRG